LTLMLHLSRMVLPPTRRCGSDVLIDKPLKSGII
jgi:hypothetical protein